MSVIHWANAISSDFGSAADWVGDLVPGPSDSAVLDAPGSSFTVTASTSQTVGDIQLAPNANLDIRGGTFIASAGTGPGANAGNIFVGAGASLVVGGLVQNDGAISITGAADSTASMLLGENATLSGGGDIHLNGFSALYNNVDAAAGSGVVILTNIDNTIIGIGEIAHNNSVSQTLNIVNESKAVINAASSSGGFLSIGGVGPTNLVNFGLIEASGNTLLSVGNANVSGAGGRVLAHAGVGIRFVECVIQGQHFSVETNGVLDFLVADAVTVGGKIKNSGTVILESSRMTLNKNLTFTGGGVFLMERFNRTSGPPAVLATRSPIVFTNVDNTIRGAGSLGDGRLTLINKTAGIIVSDAPGNRGLTINTGKVDIVNDGTFIVSNGTMKVLSAVIGSGQAIIEDGGTLELRSIFSQNVTFAGGWGRLNLASSQAYTASITGFSLEGGSTLDLMDVGFIFVNEATFSGAASSGVLTVTDGVHTAHITLVGDYTHATFTAAADQNGGTIVTAHGAGGAIPPSVFVAAMASLKSSSACSGHVNAVASVPAQRLELGPPSH